jgi:hypothetical protein
MSAFDPKRTLTTREIAVDPRNESGNKKESAGEIESVGFVITKRTQFDWQGLRIPRRKSNLGI